MHCVALKTSVDCTCVSLYRCGVRSLSFNGVCHGFRASWVEQPIRFGEGYEVDLRPRRLRRGGHFGSALLKVFVVLILFLLPPYQFLTLVQDS
jgi:hypothetical protein